MDDITIMLQNKDLFEDKDQNNRYKIINMEQIKTYLNKNYPETRRTEVIKIIELH